METFQHLDEHGLSTGLGEFIVTTLDEVVKVLPFPSQRGVVSPYRNIILIEGNLTLR